MVPELYLDSESTTSHPMSPHSPQDSSANDTDTANEVEDDAALILNDFDID